MRRASPVPSALDKIRSEDGQSMAYLFCFVEPDPTSPNTRHALARFFFPAGGAILEDPATGSATANFGAWCAAMKQELPLQVQISQGEFADRPSTLFLEVNRQAQVFVGGDVLEIGRGTITL